MGDGSADRIFGNRPVLADVSNQLGKRRFVSISSNSGINIGNSFQKNVENESGKSVITRKDCEGVGKSIKGKCVFEFGSKGDLSLLKPRQLGGSLNLGSGVKPLQENAAIGISGVPGKIKELPILYKGSLPFVRGDAVKQSVLVRGDDGLKDSCISSGLMGLSPRERDKTQNTSSTLLHGGECEEEGTDSDGNMRIATGSNTVNKAVNNVGECNIDRIDAGDLTSNKSSSIGCSIPSSVSKACEWEKCTAFNGDSSSNTSTGVDFLKSCSCSFCLKAAYIWSDLHYQDTKGQIAALKRSRKEVRSAIERSTFSEFEKNVQGSSNNSTKLEHNLMGQWRSLFLHTEDILIRESTQLQSSLHALKELRENCKADLEMTHVVSSDK